MKIKGFADNLCKIASLKISIFMGNNTAKVVHRPEKSNPG
jgi:hypothetical protein